FSCQGFKHGSSNPRIALHSCTNDGNLGHVITVGHSRGAYFLYYLFYHRQGQGQIITANGKGYVIALFPHSTLYNHIHIYSRPGQSTENKTGHTRLIRYIKNADFGTFTIVSNSGNNSMLFHVVNL